MKSAVPVDVLIFTDSNGALGFGRYAGPYRIATALREKGFTVQVVEFFADLTDVELDQIFHRFLSEQTLWVGFSSTLFTASLTHKQIIERISKGEYNNSLMIEDWTKDIFPRSYQEMENIFAKIKAVSEKIQIVVGGSKAARENFSGVDWWLWGEADRSAVALSEHLRDSDKTLKATVNLDGSRRVLSSDYPIEHFSNYSIDWHPSDAIFHEEHLPIELSRGCIFKCSYCSFKNTGRGKNELVRDAGSLKNEFLRNWHNFGSYGYMFSDDTFNDSLEKVINIAKIVEDLPFRLEWAGYCRLDLFQNMQLLEAVKRSGARFINFGIETFCWEAGKAVGKGFHPDKTKELLHKVKAYLGRDVILSCNFIVGLKYESEESIWQTVEWLNRPDSPVDGYNFTPLYVIHNRRPVDEKTAVFANKIGLDPEQHGYDYDPSSGDWKHELMTRVRAHEIVNEIYKLDGARKKTLANRIGFYGRLKNLGVSYEQLITIPDDQVLLHLTLARENLRQKYIKNILALSSAHKRLSHRINL
ncbi:radical SAM protein [bacterium]|nr:radical SAM protein [bacterium]